MTVIALVEDHRLFSTSLAVLLRSHGFEVLTPPLVTVEGLRVALSRSQPQIVLLDRDLGALGSGEELIGPVSTAGAAVVVVSGTLDDVVIGRCFALGATACVSKSEPLEQLLFTVSTVARGARPVGEEERRLRIAQWRRWQASAQVVIAPFARLTAREASVLADLMEGKSVRAIAAESSVTEATIRSQVRSLLAKLDVNSQLEAVGLAARVGWRPSAN